MASVSVSQSSSEVHRFPAICKKQGEQILLCPAKVGPTGFSPETIWASDNVYNGLLVPLDTLSGISWIVKAFSFVKKDGAVIRHPSSLAVKKQALSQPISQVSQLMECVSSQSVQIAALQAKIDELMVEEKSKTNSGQRGRGAIRGQRGRGAPGRGVIRNQLVECKFCKMISFDRCSKKCRTKGCRPPRQHLESSQASELETADFEVNPSDSELSGPFTPDEIVDTSS